MQNEINPDLLELFKLIKKIDKYYGEEGITEKNLDVLEALLDHLGGDILKRDYIKDLFKTIDK